MSAYEHAQYIVEPPVMDYEARWPRERQNIDGS